MKKRYYIAYGSNLNIRQMLVRCPDATIIGTANLQGWELLFKGSRSGSYLTIERSRDGIVPVAVWNVTEADETALDHYEGVPTFYYKKDIRLQCSSIHTGRQRMVTAFAYIMHEERPVGVPTVRYMQTCLAGYDDFLFDKQILMAAYGKCREAVKK